MKFLLLLAGFCIIGNSVLADDYVSADKLDFLKYERGPDQRNRISIIKYAFTNCTDLKLKKYFFESPFLVVTDSFTRKLDVKADTNNLAYRYASCGLIDLDGDGVSEILYHEVNLALNYQKALILKRDANAKYQLIFSDFGVFTGINFENRILKTLVVAEQHANAYPFDRIKIRKVILVNGKLELSNYLIVNVPYYYMYPVHISIPNTAIEINSERLFLYYKELFKGRNFPYKIEMRKLFDAVTNFDSQESAWMELTRSTMLFIGRIENRGDFSSLLIAFNTAFSSDFPEYIFTYVPNDVIKG